MLDNQHFYDRILSVMGNNMMTCREVSGKVDRKPSQVSKDLSYLWKCGHIARHKTRGTKYRFQIAALAPVHFELSGLAPSKMEIEAVRFGPLTAPAVRLENGLYDITPVLMGDPPPGRSALDQRQRGA